MKKLILYLLMVINAWPTLAQSAAPNDGFFDPQRDPVASTFGGRIRLVVSEDVLVRSATKNSYMTHYVGRIEQVDRKEIEGFWNLTLQSRYSEDMEQSVFLAIRLRPDGKGNYFAGSYWTACVGEGCGECGLSIQRDGCYCLQDKPGEPGTPGACYQITSDEPILIRVPLKEKM
jgi:hypothetical protein